MSEQPLFPPHAVCVCGCTGAEHEAVWEDDEFKGTRCEAHGGHKFAFAQQAGLFEGAAATPTTDGNLVFRAGGAIS